MKRVLFIFAILLSIQAQAQYSNFIETSSSIKIGAGYTHDFPGLNGYTITGEVTFPFAPHFEGGIGLKKIDLSVRLPVPHRFRNIQKQIPSILIYTMFPFTQKFIQ